LPVTSIGFAFIFSSNLTSVTFATGSNVTAANFGLNAFPVGNLGATSDALKTAYLAGGAGTYTRASGGSTWTK